MSAVLTVALLLPATASALAELGRWQGTARNGEHVAFVVRTFAGRRVISAPSVACPNTPIPGIAISHYTMASLDNDTYSENGHIGAAVVTPIGTDGRFAYTDVHYVPTSPLLTPRSANEMYGTLAHNYGRVRITEYGPPCTRRLIEVHFVSPTVRRNGIYEGAGSYLTKVAFQVFSGGSLLNFLVDGGARDTQFAGPPDPRTTEELGPAAGLEACVSGFSLGVVPVLGRGVFRLAQTDTLAPEPGVLAVTGRFVSPIHMIGAYAGYFTLDGETDCPLPGIWAATRTSGPTGTRWPTGYRPPRLRHPTCRLVRHIVDIRLGKPEEKVIEHINAAINGPEHWPRVLIINRPFAAERRTKLMRARKLATRPGEDRDEYPPATLRGRGPGLERGRNPTGWEADLFRVPSRQNRLAGNIQSNTTGPYCDGQRVEFTWP